MARRALIWALALPLVGASVLVGHRLAYALTGAEPGSTHDYLAHAPQVLAVLVLLALMGLALETRSSGVSPRWLATVGLVAFAAQEHLERIVHGESVGLLLLDPTFVVGLALQVPVGLLVARLARRAVAVLRAPVRPRPRPPLTPSVPLVGAPLAAPVARRLVSPAVRERGPPRAPRP